MSEGLFALGGALLGVIGTLSLEWLRARRDRRTASTEALRQVGVDFMSHVSRVRRLLLSGTAPGVDQDLVRRAEDLFAEARADFERLCITSTSADVIRAGRYLLHYTSGVTGILKGRDFNWPSIEDQIFNWSTQFRLHLRRELGVTNPDAVFYEPAEGMPSLETSQP